MPEVEARPEPVRKTAIVLANREVMWPLEYAAKAIEAITAAGWPVLGADLRSDGPQRSLTALATELPWFTFEPASSADPLADSRDAAIASLTRPEVEALAREGYRWVFLTW